jgi:hypothetical protein
VRQYFIHLARVAWQTYSAVCSFAENFCFCWRDKHFLQHPRLNIYTNLHYKISISKGGARKARVDQGSAARSKLCKRAAASTRKNNNVNTEREVENHAQETLLDRKADAPNNANEPTPLAYLSRRLFRITYLAPSDGQISFFSPLSQQRPREFDRVETGLAQTPGRHHAKGPSVRIFIKAG